jgi:hypothetical protein
MRIAIRIALLLLHSLDVCMQGSGYAEAADAQAALRCWEQAALVRLPAELTATNNACKIWQPDTRGQAQQEKECMHELHGVCSCGLGSRPPMPMQPSAASDRVFDHLYCCICAAAAPAPQ